MIQKEAARQLELRAIQQRAQEFQAGNSGQALSGKNLPEYDHQPTVGDGKITFLHRRAIGRVRGQVRQRRCGRYDDKMAFRTKLQQPLHVAGKKFDPKDGLKFLHEESPH